MSKAILDKRHTPTCKHCSPDPPHPRPGSDLAGGQSDHRERPAFAEQTISAIASQSAVVFREGDTLDDFLDRIMLRLYDQVCLETGGHSQAAKLLRTHRTGLYQRVRRAKERLEHNPSKLLHFVALIATQNS